MLHNVLSRRKQREKCEGGQSLLEFALTFPLLIILLLAMVVIAWVGFSYMSIASAARMGARWMCNYPYYPDQPLDPGYASVDDEIKAHVFAAMPMLNTSEPTTVVTIEPPADSRGSRTRVWVRIHHTVNLPTIRIPYVIVDGGITLSQPMQLVAESTMILE